MSRLAKLEDLLERSVEHLRAALEGIVESSCNLKVDYRDEAVPVPGTMWEGALGPASELIALIQQIEGEIGRFDEHANPQWLDDLLDGKWSLTEPAAAGEVRS